MANCHCVLEQTIMEDANALFLSPIAMVVSTLCISRTPSFLKYQRSIDCTELLILPKATTIP